MCELQKIQIPEDAPGGFAGNQKKKQEYEIIQ